MEEEIKNTDDAQKEDMQAEPKKKKPYKTWTYLMNHTAIMEAFMKIIKKRNRRPTMREWNRTAYINSKTP